MGQTKTIVQPAVSAEQFPVVQQQPQFPFPVDPLGMLLLQSLYMLMYSMMMMQHMMTMMMSVPPPMMGLAPPSAGFQQPMAGAPASGYKIVELKRDANGNIMSILEK